MKHAISEFSAENLSRKKITASGTKFEFSKSVFWGMGVQKIQRDGAPWRTGGSRGRAGTGEGGEDGLFLPLLRRQGFRSGAVVLSRCCREAPSSSWGCPSRRSRRRPKLPPPLSGCFRAVLLGPRAHLPALALQPAHPLLAPLGPHPRSVGWIRRTETK